MNIEKAYKPVIVIILTILLSASSFAAVIKYDVSGRANLQLREPVDGGRLDVTVGFEPGTKRQKIFFRGRVQKPGESEFTNFDHSFATMDVEKIIFRSYGSNRVLAARQVRDRIGSSGRQTIVPSGKGGEVKITLMSDSTILSSLISIQTNSGVDKAVVNTAGLLLDENGNSVEPFDLTMTSLTLNESLLADGFLERGETLSVERVIFKNTGKVPFLGNTFVLRLSPTREREIEVPSLLPGEEITIQFSEEELNLDALAQSGIDNIISLFVDSIPFIYKISPVIRELTLPRYGQPIVASIVQWDGSSIISLQEKRKPVFFTLDNSSLLSYGIDGEAKRRVQLHVIAKQRSSTSSGTEPIPLLLETDFKNASLRPDGHLIFELDTLPKGETRIDMNINLPDSVEVERAVQITSQLYIEDASARLQRAGRAAHRQLFVKYRSDGRDHLPIQYDYKDPHGSIQCQFPNRRRENKKISQVTLSRKEGRGTIDLKFGIMSTKERSPVYTVSLSPILQDVPKLLTGEDLNLDDILNILNQHLGPASKRHQREEGTYLLGHLLWRDDVDDHWQFENCKRVDTP